MASARALTASARGRWALGAGTGAVTLALAVLAARHFARMSWPLSTDHPGLLVGAAFLLVLAQALKAFGWGRLFIPSERPTPIALAAGNGGAALIGVLLPGRFDDAMRIAVVRRYPGCPAGVRVLCLSLVMLGLIDSVALAPLALAGAALPNTRASAEGEASAAGSEGEVRSNTTRVTGSGPALNCEARTRLTVAPLTSCARFGIASRTPGRSTT